MREKLWWPVRPLHISSHYVPKTKECSRSQISDILFIDGWLTHSGSTNAHTHHRSTRFPIIILIEIVEHPIIVQNFYWYRKFTRFHVSNIGNMKHLRLLWRYNSSFAFHNNSNINCMNNDYQNNIKVWIQDFCSHSDKYSYFDWLEALV